MSTDFNSLEKKRYILRSKNNGFLIKEKIRRDRTFLKTKLCVVVCMIFFSVFTNACHPMVSNELEQGGELESITPIIYDAPSHVSEVVNRWGTPKIRFEADVSIPELNSIQSIYVDKKEFTDDEIIRYIEILAGRRDEIYREWAFIKAEMLEKLNLVKQYEGTERVSINLISRLQQQVENAPIAVENPLCNITEFPCEKISKVYLPNDDETVSAFRFIRNGNSLAYFRDSSEVIITKSIYENGGFDSSIDTIEHYKWLQPGSPTISEEDAYNTAMQYINRMGLDLKLY